MGAPLAGQHCKREPWVRGLGWWRWCFGVCFHILPARLAIEALLCMARDRNKMGPVVSDQHNQSAARIETNSVLRSYCTTILLHDLTVRLGCTVE
jgi:hypothetical protein